MWDYHIFVFLSNVPISENQNLNLRIMRIED